GTMSTAAAPCTWARDAATLAAVRYRYLRIEGIVPGFEELHVAPAAAEALSAMGWNAADPAARELAPTAARGHNLVAVTPPSPAYAAPALAGVLGRIGQGVQLLLLAPE